MFDPESRTSYIAEVMPRIAIQTVLAVVGSLALTAMAMYIFTGLDFPRTVTVGQIWRVGLSISIVAPALICPLLAFRTARLMRDLSRAREELVGVTLRDPLTGLLNRRGFDQEALHAFEKATRAGLPLTALMCDIDMFKSINDKYGHEFGDLALRRMGEIIRASIGQRPAVLGRQGGEEFAILLTGVDVLEAGEIAETVRATCAAHPFAWESLQVRITLSIGVVTESHDRVELRSLLSRADAALYQAKRDGRNRIVRAPSSTSVVKFLAAAPALKGPCARA